MSAAKRALIALSCVVVLGPQWLGTAGAETRPRCLTREQQRVAISERLALPLATIRRTLRNKVPGEMVRSRLCQDPVRLI